jgi:periplasmic copper chaperone A
MSRRKEVLAVCLASALLAVAAAAGSLSEARAGAKEAASRMSPKLGLTAMTANFHVQDAWARINPVSGRPATGYVTIHYGGTTADALVSATTPLAKRVELHQHVMDKGIMRMPKITAIAIAPDSETKLSPGSYHLMLFDLTSQPKPGTQVPLTLTFKSGTRLTLAMVTQPVTAMGPDGKTVAPATGMMAHDHMGH